MYLKISSYVLLITTCHFLFVMGSNDFFNYFYNKYHKDKNSTGIPTSVLDVLLLNQEKDSPNTGVSSINVPSLSNPEMSSITANESHSPTANFVNGTGEDVLTVQHGGPGYDSRTQHYTVIGVSIGIGVVVFFACIGCCIALCCPWCYRKEKAGFIVGGFNPNNDFQGQSQQTVFPRSSSESHLNQFPPPSYSTLPLQQQYSRSQNELPQYDSSQLEPSAQNLPVQPVFQQTFIQQSAVNPDIHNPPYAPSASREYE